MSNPDLILWMSSTSDAVVMVKAGELCIAIKGDLRTKSSTSSPPPLSLSSIRRLYVARQVTISLGKKKKKKKAKFAGPGTTRLKVVRRRRQPHLNPSPPYRQDEAELNRAVGNSLTWALSDAVAAEPVCVRIELSKYY